VTRDELTRASAVAARAAAAEAKLVKAEGTVPAGVWEGPDRQGGMHVHGASGGWEGGRCVGCSHVVFSCITSGQGVRLKVGVVKSAERELCVLKGRAGVS